jgi:serine/threonine-protein kinase
LNPDRYQIIRKISDERTGVVYLASDPETNRYVFFHRIERTGRVLDIETGKLMDRARKAARLQSPHVLRVLEAGEQEACYFIIIEFCEGVTLRHMVQSGRLPYDECLGLSLALGQALREGHAGGLVHGELNPAGILVDAAGALKLPYIGHPGWFDRAPGIKTAADRDASPEAYQAPECLRGGTPDGQSDIYAAGVIMHELLHGSPPSGPVPESEKADDDRRMPSREFDRIISKAAAQDRSRRYQDSEALVEDLVFLMASESVAKKSFALPPLPALDWKEWIPWKLVVLFAAFIFLLILAFILYSSLDLP